MADHRDPEPIRAAGALVWRGAADDPEVVLVHRPKYDDWSFPKGKSGDGEHLLLTATREVAEETGLRVVLGRPLATSRYQVADRQKQVSYWAARCVRDEGFVPGHEVDELAWLSPGLARERLSYQRDARLLDEFSSGPAYSVPFILLRHAEAGAKSPAASLDLSRPLDGTGRADARLLAALLASYGRCAILSSAAERCLATVRPYAEAVGSQIEIVPAFTAPWPAEAASGNGGAEAARLVFDLACAGAPTLICGHRENLPLMLAAARSALGQDGPDQDAHDQPDLVLRKGSFIVLQMARGALVSVERQDLYAEPDCPSRAIEVV
jgi:8-oxo-dGTP pyrophosphatase MutT (NUDIX family)/phosphohistidine phosphatase SixA